jgi:hypothetical protein
LLQTCPHWNLPRIESVDWIEIWKVKKHRFTFFASNLNYSYFVSRV